MARQVCFRLELITPADDPSLAVVSRDDIRVTIRREPSEGQHLDPTEGQPLQIPELAAELVIERLDGDASWGSGRAGMRYRDLIPSRLGGRFIASHIEVCDGGPVPDQVHHHAIRFQLIFCQRGWVDVIYQDQGPAFRMNAGDAVLQPPHIRHRVLASSAGARVVEIGCPAEHDTLFDHDLELPNATIEPDRSFSGQRFVRHVAADEPWAPCEHEWFHAQTTAISAATDGLADVRVLRVVDDKTTAGSTTLRSDGHDGEFNFVFLLEGQAMLELGDPDYPEPVAVAEGTAITLPPGQPWSLIAPSRDLRLLQVRL